MFLLIQRLLHEKDHIPSFGYISVHFHFFFFFHFHNFGLGNLKLDSAYT